jgi:hypothetical protein
VRERYILPIAVEYANQDGSNEELYGEVSELMKGLTKKKISVGKDSYEIVLYREDGRIKSRVFILDLGSNIVFNKEVEDDFYADLNIPDCYDLADFVSKHKVGVLE